MRASHFIFARAFPAHMLAMLGALMIGLESFGNLVRAVPMDMLLEAGDWWAALLWLLGASFIIA